MNPAELYLQALRNPKTKYLVLALSLIYLLSPIDLIPDFIFPFGLLDDATLLILLIQGLFSQTEK